MKPTLLALGCLVFAGCATTQGSNRERGLLRLEVEPSTAEVYIDTKYQGIVNGWRGQTIPVAAGNLMVEIRAHGYMSQRFDIEVGAAEEVTLTLKMEPVLELSPETNAKTEEQ